MASPIRIRVGAALDNSVNDVFKSIVAAARVARKAVEAELGNIKIGAAAGGAGGGGGGGARAVKNQHEKALEHVAKIKAKHFEKQAKEEEAAEKRAQRKKEAAERYVANVKERQQARERRDEEAAEKRKQRQREAAERYVSKIKERYRIQEQKDQEREEKVRVAGRRKIIGGIAGGTAENLGTLGRGALGVAGSVARGAGVQTDLGAFVGQAVDLEKRAAELSAAAFTGEGGRRAVRTTSKEKGLVETAREIGAGAAYDPTKVIEGLQAFVGKTGDLKTGEAALEGLARLSRATGTNLEDIVSAAGDAAMALGEIGEGKEFASAEEKGKKLVEVMRMIAGQGKVGAVEIKDLATSMAKVGAAASSFGGDKEKNIEFMGALAQLARASGGAASAPEAATAVAGFVNTLKTPARVKEFKAAGVDVFDQDKNIRDPQSIILDALSKSKGDPIAFKKMFANVQGAKTVEPAAVAFRSAFAKAKAGGADDAAADKAARTAVVDLFNKFTKPISAEEEGESFKRNMATTASQVQLFNNKLSEIGEKMAGRILPAMSSLEPVVLRAAEGLSHLVDFAVENPGTAIVGAITASIAKAAIGTAVQTGVQKLIESASGAKGGFTLAAATITIAAATMAIMAAKETGAVGVKEDVKVSEEALLKGEKEFKQTGTISEESRQALENAKRHAEANEAELKKYREAGGDARYTGSGLGAVAGGINQVIDAAGEQTFEGIGRGSQLEEMARQLSLQKQGIDALLRAVENQGKKVQKVEVINQQSSGPSADTSATTK